MSREPQAVVDPDRREFLRNALRWGAALALGGGVFALMGRSSDCPQPCSACPDWAGCSKPSREARPEGGSAR